VGVLIGDIRVREFAEEGDRERSPIGGADRDGITDNRYLIQLIENRGVGS
jgi:hypothetical protein